MPGPPAPTPAPTVAPQRLAFVASVAITAVVLYVVVDEPLPTLAIYAIGLVAVFGAWLTRDAGWRWSAYISFLVALAAAFAIAWNTAQESEQDQARFDHLCDSLTKEVLGDVAPRTDRVRGICGFVPK